MDALWKGEYTILPHHFVIRIPLFLYLHSYAENQGEKHETQFYLAVGIVSL